MTRVAPDMVSARRQPNSPRNAASGTETDVTMAYSFRTQGRAADIIEAGHAERLSNRGVHEPNWS
jgi:hypothetical protein